MYFDTDILLKYSDPTLLVPLPSCAFVTGYAVESKVLISLHKVNLTTHLAQMSEASWQAD